MNIWADANGCPVPPIILLGSHVQPPALTGRHGPSTRARTPAAADVAGTAAPGSSALQGMHKAANQARPLPAGRLAAAACHHMRAPGRRYLGLALAPSL